MDGVMNDVESGLMDLLRGYARGNKARLYMLAALSGDSWRLCAEAELQRRVTGIVSSMEDETLKAIANGALDFQSLCQQVVAESQ